MSSGIYKIENKLNGKVYIGSAVNFTKRFRCHISTLNSKKHKNDKLQKAWNKYGENNFNFILVLTCTVEELLMFEQIIINTFNSVTCGYNIAPVAGNSFGTKHTEETKQKMKKAWELRRLTPKKPMSEEVKLKISESKKGKKRKPFTEEAKKNMSLSRMGNKNRLGIPHTEETKQKMKLLRNIKKENTI